MALAKLTLVSGIRRILNECIFPTKYITLWEVLKSETTHHPETLSAMMHSMRGQVEERGADGFLARWVVEIISEGAIVATAG